MQTKNERVIGAIVMISICSVVVLIDIFTGHVGASTVACAVFGYFATKGS